MESNGHVPDRHAARVPAAEPMVRRHRHGLERWQEPAYHCGWAEREQFLRSERDGERNTVEPELGEPRGSDGGECDDSFRAGGAAGQLGYGDGAAESGACHVVALQ